MSDFTAHDGPSWAETEPVPDSERAGRPRPRDEAMAEIVAHRQAVFERDLRGGEKPADPPPEPRREPRRDLPSAPALPERREFDLGDGRRVNLTQADLLRLAETGLRIPQVAAAAREMHIENCLNTIANEFPDIFNDRDRARLTTIQLAHLREQDAALGLQRPDLEAMREAAARTRALIGPRAKAMQHRARGLRRRRGSRLGAT